MAADEEPGVAGVLDLPGVFTAGGPETGLPPATAPLPMLTVAEPNFVGSALLIALTVMLPLVEADGAV